MKLTIIEDTKDNFLFHFTPEHLIDKMLEEWLELKHSVQIEEKHHRYIEHQAGKDVDWMTFIECTEDYHLILPAELPEVKIKDYERWGELNENMMCADPWSASSKYRRMTSSEVYILFVESMLQSKQKEDSKFLFMMRFLRQEDESEDMGWLQRWAVDVIEQKKGVIGVGK